MNALFKFAIVILCSVSVARSDDKTEKIRLPKECTDSENYDMTDCEKARELSLWSKAQEKLPDNKRTFSSGLGDDLLLERATNYRVGIHIIKLQRNSNPSIGLKVGTPSAYGMFALNIGGLCDVDNSIKVLENTEHYIFLFHLCESNNRYNSIDKSYHWLIYNKQYSRLDEIIGADHQDKLPSLTFAKQNYKFRWPDYKQSDGSANPIFYDFKITGNRSEDLQCGKTWNDECDISLQEGPLAPDKYKIVD